MSRTCPFCKEAVQLVMKDEHLTCPECHHYLIQKDEPGWDAAWAARIKMDEYWIGYYGMSDGAEAL